MPFNANDDQIEQSLTTLHRDLTAMSRQLGRAGYSHTLRCREEAVQQVMTEVTDHVRTGAPLPLFEEHNVPVEAIADLARYARRRLRTVFNTLMKQAQRDGGWEREWPVDAIRISTVEAPATEHPVYTRRFLKRFLDEVQRDLLAYRLAILIINSHTLPGTLDLDPCNNTIIARILECKPGDVRNARYRIETIKNRILSELSDENPED